MTFGLRLRQGGKKREKEICGSLLACWDSGRWWAEVELIFLRIFKER